MLRLLVILILAIMILGSCSESPDSTGNENRPPETHIALTPDGELRTTTSRQHIRWWGDDPDGFIAGFFFSFDGNAWHFTTKNDSVFALALSGSDTTYTFSVRAVDDQGNRTWDANGPYGPEPFTDKNGNGRYDIGEPFIDFGLWDPTPATLRYPVQNTPPVVEFVKGSDVPDTTFTVASFAWTGTDLDGDETIREYLYTLNDSVSSWKPLPRNQNFLTLKESDGLREGNNVFYLKAVDIAGASSRIIRMPSVGKTWFVKKPSTDLLIVDDYNLTDETANFYRAIIDTLLGGRFRGADVLDIRVGSSSTKKGTFVPPYINPTLLETFKLFQYIVWYSDNTPTIDIAQLTLPQYQQAGGKIVYIASFPETAIDPRGGITDFAPVDSLSPSAITFVPANTRMEADSESPGYPSLTRDTRGVPVAFIRPLFKKINASNMYRFAADPRWEGNPVVAVRSGDQRFILFGVPLHRFDGQSTVGPLFYHLFTREFGAR